MKTEDLFDDQPVRPKPNGEAGMHVGEASVREVEEIPSMENINEFELLSISLTNNTSGLTHGLHRFPAKYIPQIPRWAMHQFANAGGSILDPFMGSGTTLVEARLRRGRSCGVDVDPLACFITQAKTTPLIPTEVIEHGNLIRERWVRPANNLSVPMSGVKNFSHWFTQEAWGWLQSLHELILESESNDDQKRFLLVVFSSILRWVSNADDQTQKTYVSGTLKKSPPPVPETFWRAFDRAIRGLKEIELMSNSDARITSYVGDACSLPLDVDDIDLVVTSPPYLDSVDYMYNAMLEYFWLGPLLGVPSRTIFNAMRRETIGAKNPADKSISFPDELIDLVDPNEINAARLPAVVAYCDRMRKHFIETARVVRQAGYYVLVVGNSQSGNGIMPVHDALLRFAADAGFELEKAFAYRIRRHYMKFPRKGRGGIILVDWVLVLRNIGGKTKVPERLPLPWLKLNEDEVAH